MCREQAAEFREHEQSLKDAGIRLVFVGSGNAFMAKAFREDLKLGSTVWSDKPRKTYEHLGFKRGMLSTVNPKAAMNAARAFAKGFRQTRTQGDPLQQGGVIVVGKGGESLYAYASAEAGDHPPIDEVLEAARDTVRAA